MAALAGGLLLFFLGAALAAGAYRALYSGRILPGVMMAGVDLSTLDPEQAAAALRERLSYPVSGRVVFRHEDIVWVATPAQLGMAFDAGISVDRAFRVGRSGGPLRQLASQLNTWQAGLELAPVIIFDEGVAFAYLQDLARQIDRPPRDADLHLDGTQVVYTPGQIGRKMDVEASLSALAVQLTAFRDAEVPLVIQEELPRILDASSQAEVLRTVLAEPLVLNVPDAGPGDPPPWTLNVDLLAGILSVAPSETGSGWIYQVSVSTQSMEQFLTQIAPLVDRAPRNARFYFDDSSGQLVLLEPAVVGRTLDVAATQQAINAGLLRGEHAVPLALNLAQPQAPDEATAAALGIDGQVSSYTSYFRGSSAARLTNIQAAAARFHGLLVPPESVFSMAEALGDVTLENGYAEALIIFNGRTITGVGGGVCQVSTTLYRAAFFGGYPIEQRYAHAFRVYYYEQRPERGTDNRLAGLDATVYVPLVDLKFRNDRPSWLLMETYFNPEEYSLTWKFYSGGGTRYVDWSTSGPRNVIPAPEPLFQEAADLPAGSCRQVDYAADGADITVRRDVYRDGALLFSDTVQTHYEPWRAIYQYGAGTPDPGALVEEGLCH
jgi:vancomycin resistance protein YoaR